jgi:hypothetical protein
VRHDDRNVVAGVADETVDQQTIVGVSAPNFDPRIASPEDVTFA